MLDTFRRLIGAIKVIEKGDQIEISGIPADTMSRDIAKIWNTSKINLHLFTKIGRSSFSFNRFFAVDVLYMLETLMNDKKAWTNTRVLNQIIEELLANTWLGDVNADDVTFQSNLLDYSELRALTVTMLPSQMGFLEVYNKYVPKYRLSGYLLAADPGTGKTLNSLGLGLCLKADVTIIASPNNAVFEVWEQTIKTRFKSKQDYCIFGKVGEITSTTKYIIVHYEGLRDLLAYIKNGHLQWDNPFIILDECHNLNEIESVRTQTFIELCKQVKSKHVLWMSGTPVKALGSEMIPLLHCIDPYFDRDAEERFKKVYGKNSARAVDILSNRLGLIRHTVKKDSTDKVITERRKVKIPNSNDYTLDTIRLQMSDFIKDRYQYYDKHRVMYQRTYDDGIASFKSTLHSSADFKEFQRYQDAVRLITRVSDYSSVKDEIKFCNQYEKQRIIPSLPPALKNDFKDARSVVKYVSLKIQGEALGRVFGKKREQCAVDMVAHAKLDRYIDSGIKKTVIFTSYVEALRKMESHLRFVGYKPLAVFQETNKDLSGIIRQFDQNIDINPLIATYKSLSTAVPLVMANVMVMLDSPFRDYIYQQAVARLDRLGQDTTVYVYELSLDTGELPNISTRSVDILQWSRDQVAAIMGVKVDDVIDVSMESLDTKLNNLEVPISLEHLDGDTARLVAIFPDLFQCFYK